MSANQRLAKGEDIVGVAANPIQIASGLADDLRVVGASDPREVGSARRDGHEDVRAMRQLVADDEHEALRAEGIFRRTPSCEARPPRKAP